MQLQPNQGVHPSGGSGRIQNGKSLGRRRVTPVDRPAADGRPIAPELRSVDRPPAAAYQLAEADRAAASKPRLRPAA